MTSNTYILPPSRNNHTSSIQIFFRNNRTPSHTATGQLSHRRDTLSSHRLLHLHLHTRCSAATFAPRVGPIKYETKDESVGGSRRSCSLVHAILRSYSCVVDAPDASLQGYFRNLACSVGFHAQPQKCNYSRTEGIL